jgi:imidazoleglycerol-phosphate dehydratase
MTSNKVDKRSAVITRTTEETDIELELAIDGTGRTEISTSVPFLDHMLSLMTAHGFFDLTIRATGDIEIDGHHTVEDIGIVLGEAFAEALGDRRGIRRYGAAVVPMDEVLASVVLDFSNRPLLAYRVTYASKRVGNFDVELVQEFFKGFVGRCGATLHINVLYGENTHHIIEAIYKAFGRALDDATTVDPRISGVLSTKGIL